MQRPSTTGLRAVTVGDRRGGTTSARPKLLDRVREAVRSGHYNRSTERSYCNWINRFILFRVRTTMVYTYVLNRGGKGVRSRVDTL